MRKKFFGFFKKNILVVFLLFISFFLRFYLVEKVPPSLFGDELDVGYHAYSVIKTGKDYSGNFLPLEFHSIAEWRTPLFIYSTIPTVFIFGITPLGVRLPSIIFGTLGVGAFYLLLMELSDWLKIKKGKLFALLGGLFLSINPWHIHYSRAAFEATELLFFLTLGLFFFLKSFKKGFYLPLSFTFFLLTPWIYSTAKLFIPLFFLTLFFVWGKDILKIKRKFLIGSFLIATILTLPLVYTIFVGHGAERASYLDITKDKDFVISIEEKRLKDMLLGQKPFGFRMPARFFHNKMVEFYEKVFSNYLKTFSFDFLFTTGDPNLRHSIKDMGLFYKIEVIPLILGFSLFFFKKMDRRIKETVFSWLLLGVLPSSLTVGGGTHATRLIIVLPVFVIFIALGIFYFFEKTKGWVISLFVSFYTAFLFISFIFYLHNYYIHYPLDSERWWHSGFKEAITFIKEKERDYKKVVISTADEPPWIFFAAYYSFPPESWQKNFPIDHKIYLPGFGEISYIDKFFFGHITNEGKSIYDLPKFIDKDTLYLATFKEVGFDLLREPERKPEGLILVKTIKDLKGYPIFYFFTKAADR